MRDFFRSYRQQCERKATRYLILAVTAENNGDVQAHLLNARNYAALSRLNKW